MRGSSSADMPYSGDVTARLDRALNPKVVAVVGDKKAMGYMWLHAMKPSVKSLNSSIVTTT